MSGPLGTTLDGIIEDPVACLPILEDHYREIGNRLAALRDETDAILKSLAEGNQLLQLTRTALQHRPKG